MNVIGRICGLAGVTAVLGLTACDDATGTTGDAGADAAEALDGSGAPDADAGPTGEPACEPTASAERIGEGLYATELFVAGDDIYLLDKNFRGLGNRDPGRVRHLRSDGSVNEVLYESTEGIELFEIVLAGDELFILTEEFVDYDTVYHVLRMPTSGREPTRFSAREGGFGDLVLLGADDEYLYVLDESATEVLALSRSDGTDSSLADFSDLVWHEHLFERRVWFTRAPDRGVLYLDLDDPEAGLVPYADTSCNQLDTLQATPEGVFCGARLVEEEDGSLTRVFDRMATDSAWAMSAPSEGGVFLYGTRILQADLTSYETRAIVCGREERVFDVVANEREVMWLEQSPDASEGEWLTDLYRAAL